MAGPFETACQRIMDELASITGDPARALKPYYVYGRKAFDNGSDKPPAVRCRKLDGVIGPSNVSSGFGVTGSLGVQMQTIVWRVWGNDEEETNNEFQNLLRAMKATTHGASLSSLFEAPYTWFPDDGDRTWRGEMIEFEMQIPAEIANTPSTITQILTASWHVSSSVTGTYNISNLFPAGSPENEWAPWVSGSVLTGSNPLI